jgi:hypothetical protein
MLNWKFRIPIGWPMDSTSGRRRTKQHLVCLKARSRIEHYYEAYAEANLLLASQPSPLPKRVTYYFQSWNTHILSGNK